MSKHQKISAMISLCLGIISVCGILWYRYINQGTALLLTSDWNTLNILFFIFILFILTVLINLLFQFRFLYQMKASKLRASKSRAQKTDIQESNKNTVKSTRNIGTPFPQSYWVVPGKFLAGSYPGSEDFDLARRKLKRMLDAGIRHVISLMEPAEVNWDGKPLTPYEEMMKGMADTMNATVTFHRMPIRDMSVPSDIQMNLILDLIDMLIQHEQPVFIHCWAGRGRTGTVVGCYLLRHGYASKLNVLKVIEDLRKKTEGHDNSSPVTPSQINFLLSWKNK